MRTLLYVVPALLAAMVCGAWAWQSASSEQVRLAVLLLCGLVLALALRTGLRPPQGQLVWDGQAWRWEAVVAAQVGTVRARLDGQTHLLLEFQPAQGRSVWLWVERGTAPLSWGDLRRAVYAAPAEELVMPVVPGRPS